MRRNYRGRRNTRKSKNFLTFIDDKRFIKYLSFFVIFLLLCLVCTSVFYNLKNFFNKKNLEVSNPNNVNTAINSTDNTQNSSATSETTDSSFTLSAIGNIMCTNSLCNDSYVDNEDEYDFFHVFNDIYRYIKLSDIAIGNFNSNFAGIEKGFDNTSNSPDDLGKNLKRLGIDILSTANSHSLDMGFDGLSRTIDVLNSSDIPHTGTYKSR